jgi:hypothetical protein
MIVNDLSNASPQCDTSGFHRFWLIGCLLLAAFFGIRALSASRTDSHATPSPVAAAPTTPTLKNIEDIRVGERVRTENPTGELDLTFGEDVDPETWRHLELRLQKPDGTVSEINLLRPATWVEATGAHVGGTLPVDIGETGIRGRAEIMYLGPCPPIQTAKGRIVTGTFKHVVSGVVDVHVTGQAAPTGATANHPIWSVDRQDFIPAGDLQSGERLLGRNGVLQVAQVVPRPGTTTVHNIEIQVAHVYHISPDGILVHNANRKCVNVDVFLDDALEGVDGAHHLDDLLAGIEESLEEGSKFSRPYLRDATREAIERATTRNANGDFLDEAGNVISNWHYGHKEAYEHRRIAAAAEELGLSQAQLNDYVNARPQFFQIEDAVHNLSHQGEKSGIDGIEHIIMDMTTYFGL